RPLFPKRFRNETQVLATVLSAEEDHEPAPLAILGASAALMLSDLPWHGPAAGVRAVLLRDRLMLAPSRKERAQASFEAAVSCGPQGLTMIEGGGREASEAELLDLLQAAEKALAPVLDTLREWRHELGVVSRALPEEGFDEGLLELARERFGSGLRAALTTSA